MKRIFFITSLLLLSSCTNSEKVNGVYHGQLEHNGNTSIGADVSLTENGNNYVYMTISSTYGNFVNSSIKINPQNESYNLTIETVLSASYPNQIIDLIGYYNPEDQKKIHFSYTIDVDGVPGGTTIDGSFSGNKN